MMVRNKIADSFYIDDHALIYGLLAKEAEVRLGQNGYAAAEKGTILYAKERGVRMAQRCLDDGGELTTRNYLTYGEWLDSKGWMQMDFPEIFPDFLNRVNTCGWNATWRKYGLLRYGALYCAHADKMLVKGFNPRNELEVDTFLTHDDPNCNFNWLGANFTSQEDFQAYLDTKKRIARYTLQDFLYHCGHVLSAMSRTYFLELGVPDATAIIKAALKAYEEIMGTEKRRALVEEAKQDFLAV